MNTDTLQAAKTLVLDWWEALESADADHVASITAASLAADAMTYGPDPINTLQGPAAYLEGFWWPLRHAFSGLKRHSHLFVSGYSNGRRDGDVSQDGRLWVSGTGVFEGVFERDYLGLPATGKRVEIRFGEFCELENAWEKTKFEYLILLHEDICYCSLIIIENHSSARMPSQSDNVNPFITTPSAHYAALTRRQIFGSEHTHHTRTA